MMSDNALGLIETRSLKGALKAFDAASKSGKVAIASAEPTENGHMAVKIEGDWAAVQAAMEAGARAAEQVGELISLYVIPRSDSGIKPILPYHRFLARYTPEYSTVKEPKIKTRPSLSKTPTTKKPKVSDQPESKRPVSEAQPEPRPKVQPSPVPQPHPEPTVVEQLKPAITNSSVSPINIEELEKLSVVKLRQFARTVANLPIQGRQISMANKQQLLEALKIAGGGTSPGD
ncbi:MAG: BMC domain-containing protein [candidate division Zixibacteria bacterium]|nr:BMC domain-containing protein [candidate division Zixibacteria bacterium]